MAWLDNPYPQVNWGGPPQFSAAPIAGLVALRQQQQQHVQNQLLNAIQQYQRDRVANALLEAAPGYGLPDTAAVQGTGEAGLRGYGGLAALVRQQQAEEARSSMYGAHEDLYRARINALQNAPAGYPSQPETFTDDQGRQWRKGRYGWVPLAQGSSDKGISANELISGYGVTAGQLGDPNAQHGAVYDKDLGGYRYANPDETPTHVAFGYPTVEEGKKAGLKAGQIPPIPKGTTVLSNEEAQSLLQSRKGRKTAPSGGADQNLAPGYGIPKSDVAASREEAKVGQPYYAPDGTIRTRTN